MSKAKGKQESGQCLVRNTNERALRARDQYLEPDRQRALKVIEACDQSLTAASERLGISVPTLSRWRAQSRAARTK